MNNDEKREEKMETDVRTNFNFKRCSQTIYITSLIISHESTDYNTSKVC